MFIYSWNEASEGAKALANELGIKRIKHENSRFKGNFNKIVINWGSSTLPAEVDKCKILNNSGWVAAVSNKLSFFQSMSSDYGLQPDEFLPRIPEYTVDQEVARNWLLEGKTVCAREKLRGSGGEGLTILTQDTPNWIAAPLYTLYVPKISEWRVHLVDGKVIHIQKKAKRLDFEGDRDTQIRNLANGYVYATGDIGDVPEDVTLQATKAMAASGLDFGAIDVVFNRRLNQAFVLEINSAPGLAPTVCSKYAEAFKEMM